MLGIGVLLISLMGAAAGGKPGTGLPPPSSQGGKFELKTVPLPTLTGTGQENSDSQASFSVNVTNLVSLTVTLTWEDEANADSRHTNTPDELGLSVTSPANESKSEPPVAATQGSAGVSFTFPVTEKTVNSKTSKAGMGSWKIVVSVGNCGDQVPRFNIFGQRTFADTGNAYTLDIECNYFAKVKGGR